MGQTAGVSITMSNTGTSTWTAGSYFLGSQNPQGNTTWGPSQVGLASSVAPGAQVTLTFNITAPSVAGAYNFQWQMKQGTSYFGASTTNVAINITAPTDNASFVSQTVSSFMEIWPEQSSPPMGCATILSMQAPATWQGPRT